MSDAATKAAAKEARQPILIDLGRKKRKKVKKLRRGSGPLMREVNDAIEELRSSGAVEGTGQDVVIVVREKKKRRGSSWSW